MPTTRAMQANQKGGPAPCVGAVRRAGVGDSLMDGDQKFSGSGRGGVQWEGTDAYDNKQLTFRRLNNADPSAKNV